MKAFTFIYFYTKSVSEKFYCISRDFGVWIIIIIVGFTLPQHDTSRKTRAAPPKMCPIYFIRTFKRNLHGIHGTCSYRVVHVKYRCRGDFLCCTGLVGLLLFPPLKEMIMCEWLHIIIEQCSPQGRREGPFGFLQLRFCTKQTILNILNAMCCALFLYIMCGSPVTSNYFEYL